MKKLIFISILLFAYLNSYCEGASSEVTDASCAMELGQPDLIVTSQYNISGVTCGYNIRLEATVKNNGNARAGRASYLRYYLSTNTTWDANDIYLAQDYVYNLNAGAQSKEVAFGYIPTYLSTGTYYILYVADYADVINESNEGNNVAHVQINLHTCDPLPDLIVDETGANKTTVGCGETVYVIAKVKNQDVAAAGTGSHLGYYLSTSRAWNATGTLLAQDYNTNLGPGGTNWEYETLTIPANTSPGNYYILFRADHNDVVNERHENNNMKWRAITVTCGPAQKQSTDNDMNVSNFPSPFSESTMIEFDLPEDGPVTLFVSDMTGKQVAVLLDKEQQFAGTNQVAFDGSNYPSGTYYYTIQAGEYTATKKMVLMK